MNQVDGPDKPKVRVGILVDSFVVPAWIFAILEKIQGSSYAEIALVVLNEAPRPRKGLLRKLAEHWRLLFYLGYSALDRRWFRSVPDAFAECDAENLLNDVPHIRVVPRQAKFSDWVEEADIEVIRKSNIDVMLRLGFRILRGDILKVAPHGVWSFHHGDNEVNRGGPPGFWEVMEQQDVTGSLLQVLSEELDAGEVLCKSYAATDPTSVARNQNSYFWKTLEFIPRKLKELHEVGGGVFASRVNDSNQDPQFYAGPLYRPPTNAQFLIPLCRHILRGLGRKILNSVTYEQWSLRFCFGDGISKSFRSFKPLIPPRDRFWADPHIVFHEGTYYVFIEELEYRKKVGHIAVLAIDENGKYSQPKVVLERPYHLSYPFVFNWDGTYYMVPETSANRTVELYRCARFPDQWDFVANLMTDVNAVDATLFLHDGKWWMFVGMAVNEGASPWEELFVFYSDSPASNEWTPHPLNPVVSDVRRARPAGKIFTQNNRLYRPAQDCSREYGYGLRLMHISRLSPDEYQEEEVGFAEPRWEPGLLGIHQLSFEKRLTVIDCKRRRWSLPW